MVCERRVFRRAFGGCFFCVDVATTLRPTVATVVFHMGKLNLTIA